MSRDFSMDAVMKKMFVQLQAGLPLCSQPFNSIAGTLGLTHEEVIARLTWLRSKGYLRRVGLGINTAALGLVSTLVGVRVPKRKIPGARKVVAAYKNISHNYLRDHRFNMWFTLSASSQKQMHKTLALLKKELGVYDMVSLPTEKVFKLRFNLDALKNKLPRIPACRQAGRTNVHEYKNKL